MNPIWKAALSTLLLAGCAPVPGPAPTPTSIPSAAAQNDVVRLNEPSRKLVNVHSQPVRLGSLHASMRLAGRVEVAEDSLAQVVSPTAGRIVRLEKKTGDPVGLGQPLAWVESPELMKLLGQIRATQARLAAARKALTRRQQMANLGVFSEEHYEEAHVGMIKAREDLRVVQSQLRQSLSALARQKPLAVEGIVSRQDLEILENQVRVQQAALARAQSMVGVGQEHMTRETKVRSQGHWSMRELEEVRSRVEEQQAELDGLMATWQALGGASSLSPNLSLPSPLSGWVLERKAALGDWADTEHALFRVADLRRVWVEAEARESDLPQLQTGATVEVRTKSSGKPFLGRIRRVGREIQPDRRFLPVIVEVTNTGERLRPGMLVDLDIQLGTSQGPVVPESALIREGDETFVFVEDGEVFRRKKVELGAAHDGQVVIKKGLDSGELLVISGQQQLQAETLRSTLGEAQE